MAIHGCLQRDVRATRTKLGANAPQGWYKLAQGQRLLKLRNYAAGLKADRSAWIGMPATDRRKLSRTWWAATLAARTRSSKTDFDGEVEGRGPHGPAQQMHPESVYAPGDTSS